ncbi:angiopoietin-related protein 3-like [Drosophila nasuta]|uniref:angiopoietin-related protein 3-like n=1 Tax=Drosophila nasuta TaxID=42062 RepID=UPI00295F0D18|nr:angiopoietin-related protein 3-like [Drosophila nasuta]
MQKFLNLLTFFLIVAPRWTGSVQLNEDIQKKIEENEKKIGQLEAEIHENEKSLNFDKAINSTRDYISSLENQLNQCREQSKNHSDILQMKINDNENKLKIKDEIIAKLETTINDNVSRLSSQGNEINKNNQQLEDYRDLIESLKSIIKPCENVTSLLESGNNKINQQNSKLDATCLNSVNELQQENTKLNSQLQNNTMEITYLENQLTVCELNYTNLAEYQRDQQILLVQCQKNNEDIQKTIGDRKLIQNELNDCKNYRSDIENQLRVTQLNSTDLQEELTNLNSFKEKSVESLPDSCIGWTAGTLKIQLPNKESSNVLCDDDGWMIIQRRINGEQDFNKNWQEYVNGFGDINGEFWIGLEKLHLLTSSERYQLNILMTIDGYTSFVEYEDFRVGNSESLYELESLGKFIKGSKYPFTINSLTAKANKKFSTYDKKNNSNTYENCAKNGMGGWWYSNYCSNSNLNAPYNREMVWYFNTVTSATMKIRPYFNGY